MLARFKNWLDRKRPNSRAAYARRLEHEIDEQGFAYGTLKPTHMVAVMARQPTPSPYFARSLSPEQAVRMPHE